jgi:hypothetical protein
MPGSALTQRVNEALPLLRSLTEGTKSFPLEYMTFFAYIEDSEFYRNFYVERASNRILASIESGGRYWGSTRLRERDKIKEIIKGAMDAKLV